MGPIITGALAGIVGDKTGEKMTELAGNKPHLETHGECLHNDIHAIREYLCQIAASEKRKPIYDRTTLQPGALIPMDKFNRHYNIAFVSAATPVIFQVIGQAAVTLLLSPGWNILNMPDDTMWGLPASAVSNVSITYCATDDLFGNLAIAPISVADSLTSVASSASDVQLLAANANRKGLYIFNESTAILYLAFASSVSTSSYTLQIPASGFYEMPAPIYTGTIHGLWVAANGFARITELN